MWKFYTKSFVTPFYKAFLGFFALLLLVAGVFMEYKQHVLLAERLMSARTGIAGILLAFTLFAFFQIRFQVYLLRDPRYRIFQNLAQLSSSSFLKFHLGVWLQNYFALWVYSILLSFVGLNQGNFLKVLFIWIGLLVLFALGALIIRQKVKSPIPELKIRRSRLFPVLPYTFWYLAHLKSDRPLLLLGIKAISILILNGFLYSFGSGSYDLRWVQFGILCAAFIHIPIWLDKVEFEQDQLTYFRNLPRTVTRKISVHLSNAFLILLPEALLIGLKFGWYSLRIDQVVLICAWFALNLGLFGLIQWKRSQNDWSRIAVVSFFVLFVLTIYNFPLGILAAILFLVFYKAISSPYHL